MPHPAGRLRTLKGSGGICIGRLFFATALHKAVFCVRTAIIAACHRQERLMPLKFQPRERSVIMCDFRGYEEPEMVKKRPVVVIARNRHNGKLVTVVPLSSTEPVPLADCHHKMSENPLPDKPHIQCRAKCDMTATVGLARLDRYKPKGRDRCIPIISEEDFQAVKTAVAKAFKLY